ncbi:MAG: T9SS type A sorting domain-containing protein [Phaeodactylibacter sp.]|nr:T9SS type A sorting domain-containing protein [Phaeodactylibacter sp.]MCB9299316.1 T9SS type A sorting domain-containing protein [Lewinellaceae bacterium]
MKQLFYLILLVSGLSNPLAGQIEVPLQGNPTLQRFYAPKEAQLPKGWDNPGSRSPQNCMLEKNGIHYLEASRTAYLPIEIDTAGLGEAPGTLTCLNCDGNPIGDASIFGDSLVVTAAPDILGAQYTFTVELCRSLGCRRKSFTVLGRRAGQNYFPPVVALEAEERKLTTWPASLLPGPLACNKFIDAADAYEGRDQRIYFTTYTEADSNLYYEASRYAGTDSVYLVLCDTFAICDTFHLAFRVRHDTLKLGGGSQAVFLDDFSNDGPETDPLLWLDTDTYINATYGEDPPSLGVATFDGINRYGRPIGGNFGPADRLTSTYLDLTSIFDPLYLSFWLQLRGLGEYPEPQDIIKLEFKKPNGDWEEIASFSGVAIGPGGGQSTAFEFFSTAISPDFKHQAFQFRLTSYNDRKGIDDIWNLDYVHLSRFANDSTINDLAFTYVPRAILSQYSSMPWRHFKGREAQELANYLAVGVRNLSPQGQNADPSRVKIGEKITGIDVLDATLFNGLERNIPSLIPQNRTYVMEGDPNFPFSSYLSAMQSNNFDGYDRLEFVTEYTLENGSQSTGPGYEAILRNDRVQRPTIFDNYFAYDDGSAETGVIAQEDDLIAVRFTTAVPDSLRAVRFHFPHMVSNVANQEFNLKIWIGELDNSPEFSMNLLHPYYADSAFDTLQGFTTYPLVNPNGDFAPLGLPAGDFYVGWEQLSACTFTDCISVGYDKNSPQAKEALFFNNNSSSWAPFPENFPAGALMIRPVVGSTTPGPTAVGEAAAPKTTLLVFPNPANELVYLNLEGGQYDDYRLFLFNSVGQLLYQGPMQPQLSLAGYEPGFYLLKAVHQKSGESLQQRVVVAR